MIALILIRSTWEIQLQILPTEYSVTTKSNFQECNLRKSHEFPMTFQKRKKSHDFPRLFTQFLMIPMITITLWPPCRKSSKCLKDGITILALPLCYLVNLSIKKSLFLDQCKIAKLEPYLKRDLRAKKNYKPISLFPVVSKKIDKTIQTQMQEHLDKNGLLCKYQSGFRTDFSMNSCLVQLADFILRGIDKRFHTEMILVDWQKAFDTLDHTILLQKMECTGFKGSQSLNGFNHISHKVFCDTRKCLFRCWTNKLWCSTRIYLSAAPLPNIYK